MRHFFLIIGIIVLSFNLILACGRLDKPQKAQKPATKDAAPATHEAARHEPIAKEDGKKEAAKLKIYDEPGMAIKTEYPDTMKVGGIGSGEGSGFIFTFKPQGNAFDLVKVHIFLPRGVATAAAQEPFVTGPNGLLENNGWKKIGETKDTGEFSYGWVRKIISFSEPGDKGMGGKILLGEDSGQAVQVILYYTKDIRKEFLKNAHVILKNLHFKSDKITAGEVSLSNLRDMYYTLDLDDPHGAALGPKSVGLCLAAGY